jgi:hypothetical protein
MKVVIQMTGDKALVGVQDDNTDPFVETMQFATLEEVLAAVPRVVVRAKERWATQPKGVAYQAPAPPPVRTPTAAMTSTKATPAKPAAPKEGQMAAMF